MSTKSWKEEFYPVPAHQVLGEDAVAHSLQKWEGLRKENLDKHECYTMRDSVLDKNFVHNMEWVSIGSTSCALCEHHLSAVTNCRTCPLAIARRGERCDMGDSPYGEFLYGKNPEPMIGWLKMAIEKKKAPWWYPFKIAWESYRRS